MVYDINNPKNLSFKALKKVFTDNNVNLTRGGTAINFPNCCIISALAVINGDSYVSYCYYGTKLNKSVVKRLDSLEFGFEGWELDEDEDENGLYCSKYMEIGKRLYRWQEKKNGRTVRG